MQTPADLASLGLPPADQVGFVVRNLEQSMQLYGPMFGPWSTMDGSVDEVDYRGRKEDAKLRIAFGRSGPLEIELIEWVSGESPHAEFIRAGREGMHHIRFRVDDTDAWIEKMKTVGFAPVWYKKWCADTTFVYMERAGDPLWIEFLQMPPGGPGTAS
jgi:hypothetical protein